jgi:hypothetical protein
LPSSVFVCHAAGAFDMSGSFDEDEVDVAEAEPPRSVRARKRMWTNDLDALFLREVKLQKPHEQRHGAIRTTYE